MGVLVGFGGLRILRDEWMPEGPTLDPGLFFNYLVRGSDPWTKLYDVRSRIAKKLNSTPDITSVDELFDEDSYEKRKISHSGFPPLVFTLKIPSPMQKWGNEWKRSIPSQRLDTFRISFDGCLIVYTAKVDLSLPFDNSVFVDVRERVNEILNDEFKPESIAPNVGHGFIIAPQEYESKLKSDPIVFLEAIEKVPSDDTLRAVYDLVNTDLSVFYVTCIMANRVEEAEFDIEETQHNALKLLRTYLSLGWLHPMSRKRILSEINKNTIDVLEKISEYLVLNDSMKVGQSAIRERMETKPLIKRLLEGMSWEEHANTAPLQLDSVTRVVEHVRSEVQTFIASSANYRSALVGGIAGALATLVVTYLLKIVA